MPVFEALATRVARRAAQVLAADVCIVEGEVLVAATAPAADYAGSTVRIGWNFHGRQAEVIVAPDDGSLPPRLAAEAVRLVIENVTVVEYLPNSDELKDRFIGGLLSGHTRDEAEVRHASQVLGLDLTRPRSVILVDARRAILHSHDDDPEGVLAGRSLARAREVIHSIARFFRLPSETICGYLGDGRIAVLKACSRRDLLGWAQDGSADAPSAWTDLAAMKRAGQGLLQQLRAELGSSVEVGVGRYHPGIDGLRASYDDCRLALELGRGRPPQVIRSLDDLGLAALVAVTDERTRQSLAERLLRPLAHDQELIPTLQVFFEEDCSPIRAADRLNIHRNTLTYRLDKITALSGLNPRRFQDSAQMQVALVLQSHYGSIVQMPKDCSALE